MSETDTGDAVLDPGSAPAGGPDDSERAEAAGAGLSPEAIAALRARIRGGAYDDPAVAERVAAALVRRGIIRTEIRGAP